MAYQFNENIVITGDLNSDLFKAQNNKLIEILNIFNLRNVIDKPTRVTNHNSTLLDPIILSDTLSYFISDVLPTPSNISDHDAPIIFLECPTTITRSYKREIWIYEKVDKVKFSEKMDDVDWNALLPDNKDVDELSGIFTETFLNIARECIPTKLVTIRSSDKPWFNGELKREIRKRDRFRKYALKFKRESDIAKYKKQRNRVNNLKKLAKERFETNLDNLILSNAPNSKNYWKIMKMLIKSNKSSNNIPPLQNIIKDEEFSDIVYEDSEKCDLLNKYFGLISKLEEENVPIPEFKEKTNTYIQDIYINQNEIIDIIKTIDPNKASGPDLISHRMLKICPKKVAVPLQIILNKSLQQCKYPSSWKIANVIAIFKKGDSSLPSNYRPISLISCVGKIME